MSDREKLLQGPWHARTRRHDYEDQSGGRTWTVEYDLADGSTVRLADWLTEDSARLIAAAPEMLAALQEMLEMNGMPHRDEWINDAAFEHANAVDAQARAAIAKATGTQER